MADQEWIRNFAVIAHIDHGKSTLADRMLEITGVKKVGEGEQVLDSNPIEKERGITIKLAPVRMELAGEIVNDKLQITEGVSTSLLFVETAEGPCSDGKKEEGRGSKFILNLIDTPGHVDFGYEVSRALAACEGALLLVDATQGVQAQTLAHYYQAKKLGLKLVPVVNKIDLATAEVEKTRGQLVDGLGFEEREILEVSAKTGEGVGGLLRAVVERIPVPQGRPQKPLRALVFNSHYDIHLGVVAWVRVVDGRIDGGSELVTLGTGAGFGAEEVGYFGIARIRNHELQKEENRRKTDFLDTGEVGYVVTGLKDAHLVQAGDTIVKREAKSGGRKTNLGLGLGRNRGMGVEALPGYTPPKPMVWVAFYPVEAGGYQRLREALDKLKLTDSALTYGLESSSMLGRGFRVGFLGMLHAEVVRERLEREFGLGVFASVPRVSYRVTIPGKEPVTVRSPKDLPGPPRVIEEPILDLTIYTPERYLGVVMQLCQDRRGEVKRMGYVGGQVRLEYELPLAELVDQFYDRLKSISQGFASLDYEFSHWREGDLVRLNILLAGEVVEALAQIVPRRKVEKVGRLLVDKLAEVIPQQQFEIAIQAAIGGKIVARATVRALRKDVTAKLYGGDQTRKDKLLKKQKRGKKKLKQLGKVRVEGDVFFRLMK